MSRATMMLALLSCLWFSQPAHACGYYMTDYDKPIRWPLGTCDVPYLIDVTGIPGLDQDFETVQEAFAKWSAIECSEFKFVFAGLTQNAQVHFNEEDLDANENHVIFVKADWDEIVGKATYSNAIGLTRLSYVPKTGELLDADLMLNVQKKAFSLCETEEDKQDDSPVSLPYTVLHEAGHMVGLDHSSDSLSVMFVQQAHCPDEPITHLTPDDKECFCDYYGSDEFNDWCLNPPVDPSPDSNADAGQQTDTDSQGTPDGGRTQDGGKGDSDSRIEIEDDHDLCGTGFCCCNLKGKVSPVPWLLPILLAAAVWLMLRGRRLSR